MIKPLVAWEQQVPESFAGWVGQDIPIADDTVRVLNAYSFINRLYRNPSKSTVSLHAASWENEDTISPAPHHPDICYPAAGWKLLERKTVQCEATGGAFPMELILFERNGQRVVAAVWFQTGDLRYASGEQFKKNRSRFWGTREWPGTEKFLLQTNGSSIDASSEVLTTFAADLMAAIQSSAVDS